MSTTDEKVFDDISYESLQDEINVFDLLPDELILEICHNLPLSDLRHFSDACERFEMVCNDANFLDIYIEQQHPDLYDYIVDNTRYDSLKDWLTKIPYRERLSCLNEIYDSREQLDDIIEEYNTERNDLFDTIHRIGGWLGFRLHEDEENHFTIEQRINPSRSHKILLGAGFSTLLSGIIMMICSRNNDVLDEVLLDFGLATALTGGALAFCTGITYKSVRELNQLLSQEREHYDILHERLLDDDTDSETEYETDTDDDDIESQYRQQI